MAAILPDERAASAPSPPSLPGSGSWRAKRAAVREAVRSTFSAGAADAALRVPLLCGAAAPAAAPGPAARPELPLQAVRTVPHRSRRLFLVERPPIPASEPPAPQAASAEADGEGGRSDGGRGSTSGCDVHASADLESGRRQLAAPRAVALPATAECSAGCWLFFIIVLPLALCALSASLASLGCYHASQLLAPTGLEPGSWLAQPAALAMRGCLPKWTPPQLRIAPKGKGTSAAARADAASGSGGAQALRMSPQAWAQLCDAAYAALALTAGCALLAAARRRGRAWACARRIRAARAAEARAEAAAALLGQEGGSAAEAASGPLLRAQCARYSLSMRSVHDGAVSLAPILLRVRHARRDGTMLLDELSCELAPGRLTLVASAGHPAAASALLRLLAGREEPAPSRAQRRAAAAERATAASSAPAVTLRVSGGARTRVRACRKFVGYAPVSFARGPPGGVALRPEQSAREAIEASAALRLPSQLARAERAEYARATLGVLGLELVADCACGGDGGALGACCGRAAEGAAGAGGVDSEGYPADARGGGNVGSHDGRQAPHSKGGRGCWPARLALRRGGALGVGELTEAERLLTSLAVELVADPALLLVEDPTPFLDPPSAQRVACALRLHARHGAAVCAAVSSAGSALLGAADNLLLIGPCGDALYCGPAPGAGPLLLEIEAAGVALPAGLARAAATGWLGAENASAPPAPPSALCTPAPAPSAPPLLGSAASAAGPSRTRVATTDAGAADAAVAPLPSGVAAAAPGKQPAAPAATDARGPVLPAGPGACGGGSTGVPDGCQPAQQDGLKPPPYEQVTRQQPVAPVAGAAAAPTTASDARARAQHALVGAQLRLLRPPLQLRLRAGRPTAGLCAQLRVQGRAAAAAQLRGWRATCVRFWSAFLTGLALCALYPKLGAQLAAVAEAEAGSMPERLCLIQLNASLSQLAALLGLTVLSAGARAAVDAFGPAERAAFARERSAGASPAAYLLARTAAALPAALGASYALLLPLRAVLLPRAGFGALLLPLGALAVAAEGIGLLIAHLAGTSARPACALLAGAAALLAGVYPPLAALPAPLELASRCSPCRWLVDWLLLLLYSPLGARGGVLGDTAGQLVETFRGGALCPPGEPLASCAGVRHAALGLGAVAVLARLLACLALQRAVGR